MKEGKHKGGNLPLSQSNRKATERLTPGKAQPIYCVSHSVSVATETKRNPKGEIPTVIGTRTNPITTKVRFVRGIQTYIIFNKTQLWGIPTKRIILLVLLGASVLLD